MSNEEPVRSDVVKALVNANGAKYPIIAVAQVEAAMKPTEAERAAAQKLLLRRPNPTG